MHRAFVIGAAFLMAAAVVAVGPTSALRAQEILIGTGGPSALHHPAGRAICRLVDRKADGLTCKAMPTPGSLSNLTNVTGGAFELGIVPSDWQFRAVGGTGRFEFMDADFSSLRALFSLNGEPFTVLARRDSRIKRLDDLKGKRINIGSPGSTQRAIMDMVMSAKGWTKKDFALAEELPASQQSLALCHNRVQAMVYSVAHPDDSVKQAVELCDAQVIEVAGAAIDRLVAEYPYYAYTVIPGGMYEGHAEDVRTFGVKVTVVSSTDVDAEVIYAVVKAVFDNLDQFRRMHPAFGILDPMEMARDGLSAPLHEGAARYFRENGLR